MKNKMTRLFILIIALISLRVSGNIDVPFKVSIEGPRTYMEIYKKRAELKLVRSADFCRGYTMPHLKGKWTCMPSDNLQNKCVGEFTCKLINIKFSRVSESKRIRKELKSFPKNKSPFTMIVSKNPLKNPSKYRYIDRAKKYGERPETRTKRLLNEKVKKRTKYLKNKLTEFDEFEALEKELGIKTKSLTSSPKKEKVDKDITTVFSDEEEETESLDDAAFIVEKIESNTGKEEIIKIKRRDNNIPVESKIHYLSFTAAMTRVTDSRESAIATADIAWTPRYKFNQKFTGRGRVGGHYISSEVVEGENPETFLVYDLGGELEWFPLKGKNFYLNGGLGLQSWSSSVGGVFSTITLGGGFYFKYNKAKVVERLFLSLTNVGNDNSNKEFKVGLGATF